MGTGRHDHKASLSWALVGTTMRLFSYGHEAFPLVGTGRYHHEASLSWILVGTFMRLLSHGCR